MAKDATRTPAKRSPRKTAAAKRPAKKTASSRSTAPAKKAQSKPPAKKPATTKPAAPPRRAAPEHLDAAGRRLWHDIADEYLLRPDEYRILEDAAREADLVELLADAQREQPLMITGSMGQQVLNPIIAEVRQHRAALSQLLTKLKLPDDPSGSAGEGADTGQPAGDERATKARAAANARWQRRGA
jgi:hypothetical protein